MSVSCQQRSVNCWQLWVCSYVFGTITGMDVERTVQFLQACQRYDGGFGVCMCACTHCVYVPAFVNGMLFMVHSVYCIRLFQEISDHLYPFGSV